MTEEQKEQGLVIGRFAMSINKSLDQSGLTQPDALTTLMVAVVGRLQRDGINAETAVSGFKAIVERQWFQINKEKMN